MCELTQTELGTRTQQAHDRKQWLGFLRRDVEHATQAAVRNPKTWTDVLPWLPGGMDAKVAVLAIEGDYCEAGRVLFAALRAQIMEDAAAAAKERIFNRYGIDLDLEDTVR